uniref:Uncharacterized protein n=1 Tax=Arundo donax TaxID=35708 RepID=A0A0A9CBC2_ARUDO
MASSAPHRLKPHLFWAKGCVLHRFWNTRVVC